jgi:hypothetical protein
MPASQVPGGRSLGTSILQEVHTFPWCLCPPFWRVNDERGSAPVRNCRSTVSRLRPSVCRPFAPPYLLSWVTRSASDNCHRPIGASVTRSRCLVIAGGVIMLYSLWLMMIFHGMTNLFPVFPNPDSLFERA